MQDNPWQQPEPSTPVRRRWWSSRVVLIIFLGMAVLVGLIFFWHMMVRHTDDLDEDNIPIIMALPISKERPESDKVSEGDSVYSLISKEKSGKTALIVEDEQPILARGEDTNANPPIAPEALPAKDTIHMEDHPAKKQEGVVFVQIGSLASLADAEKERQRLLHKFAPLIQDDQVLISEKRFPGKGVFHRIHVGPFPTAAKAKALCQKLAQKGGACFIIH